MPLNGVLGRGNQIVEHPGINRGAVGGDLCRDRAGAQRPGEEAPGGGQVAPARQMCILSRFDSIHCFTLASSSSLMPSQGHSIRCARRLLAKVERPDVV